MDFNQVIEELKNGNKVRNLFWKELLYIKLEDKKIMAYWSHISEFVLDADMLLDAGWIIENDEDNMLYFNETISHLKLGKKIKYYEWKDRFLQYIDKSLVMVGTYKSPYQPYLEHIANDSWEVVA